MGEFIMELLTTDVIGFEPFSNGAGPGNGHGQGCSGNNVWGTPSWPQMRP